MRPRRGYGPGAIATVIACIVWTSSPASAHDQIDETWTTNHMLLNCSTTFGTGACAAGNGDFPSTPANYGTIVAMWQQIMLHDFTTSPACMDGLFGRQTEIATHRWQTLHRAGATEAVINQLPGAARFYVDGVVGPQTWSLAKARVKQTGDYETMDYFNFFIYYKFRALQIGIDFDLAFSVTPDSEMTPVGWYFMPDTDSAFYGVTDDWNDVPSGC